jgi:hypothetical protein
MKVNSKLAQAIHRRLVKEDFTHAGREELRDIVDIATASDLDSVQLCMLTDMVLSLNLRHATKH